MGVSGPYQVQCVELFPQGLGAIGDVGRCHELGGSPENRGQARDKTTGLPLWTVEVVDFDPATRSESRTFRVTIAAAVRPALPDPLPGTPVRPVILEGLTVAMYVTRFAKLGYSLRATGLSPVLGDSKRAA
jgi:hypothetical protein